MRVISKQSRSRFFHSLFNIILIFVRDSDLRKNKKKKKKWNGIRLWSIMTIPNQNDLKTFFSLENRALAIRDHSVTSSKFLRRIKWNGSELNWSDLKWFSIILKKKIRRDAFHRNFVHLQSINHIRRIEQKFWRKRTVAQPFWYAKACGKKLWNIHWNFTKIYGIDFFQAFALKHDRMGHDNSF